VAEPLESSVESGVMKVRFRLADLRKG
jgi:hypothetical protein